MKIKVIVLLTAFLFLCLYAWSIDYFRFQDFSIYWKAARLFLEGKNPYDLPHQTAYVTGQWGARDTYHEIYKAWTHPFSLAVFLPFGLLSLHTAKYVYLFLGGITLLASSLWCARTYLRERGRQDWYAAFLAVLCIPFGHLAYLFAYGGLGWILLGSATGALALFSSGFPFLAGLCLVVMLLKVQVASLVIAGIIWWAVMQKEKRVLAGFSAGCLLSVIIVLILNPAALRYHHELDASLTLRHWFATESLNRLFYICIGQFQLQLMAGVWIAGLLLTIYTAGRSGFRSPLRLVPVLTGLTVLFSPYVWSFDYVLCIPLLWATAGNARETSVIWARGACIASLLAFQCAGAAVFVEGASYYSPSAVAVIALLISSAFSGQSASTAGRLPFQHSR